MTQLQRRTVCQLAALGVFGGAGVEWSGKVRADDDNVLWEIETERRVSASPTVADGHVYIGDYSGTLYKLNAETGEEVWTKDVGGAITHAATVDDETAYVGTYTGWVVAVGTEGGSAEWATQIGTNIVSSANVAGELVYVHDSDGSIYALDKESGDEEWSFSTEEGNEETILGSSPTIVDGTLYVGGYDGSLYALDAESGEKQWSFGTDERIRSSPTVADGTVFVGSDDENFYAVDAEDGTREWVHRTDGVIISSPTVLDGTVYFGSADGRLSGLDTSDGDLEVRGDYDVPVTAGPTGTDGTVFAAARSYVGEMDDDRGNLKLLHQLSASRAYGSPVLVDGVLYGSYYRIVEDEDGKPGRVYAVETSVDGSSSGSRTQLGTLGHHDTWADATATRFFDVSVESATIENGAIVSEAVVENSGLREDEQTIEYTVDGEKQRSTTVSLDSGESERLEFRYEFGSDDVPEVTVGYHGEDDSDEATVDVAAGQFHVELLGTNAPLTAGETFSVEIAMENTGDLPAGRTIELLVDGTEAISERHTLQSNDRQERSLRWRSDESLEGDVQVTVSWGDDEVSETVVFEASETPSEATPQSNSTESGQDDSNETDETRTETATSTETATDASETADDDGPGFGIAGGLAGIGGVTYLLRQHLPETVDREDQ